MQRTFMAKGTLTYNKISYFSKNFEVSFIVLSLITKMEFKTFNLSPSKRYTSF